MKGGPSRDWTGLALEGFIRLLDLLGHEGIGKRVFVC